MKKTLTFFALASIMIASSGCATLFGGKVTAQQKTKPVAGQPSRSVRVVPLIADIVLFAPALIVDFATGAIYKPEETKK